MTTALVLPDLADGFGEAYVCRAVEPVTHDVSTFVLEPPAGGLPAYEPGQYVTVTVEVDGRRLSRCYSLSSPPTRPDRPTITVKRVPGGPVSNWLHDHLRAGDRLEVAGPYGSFVPSPGLPGPQLFLSAGSGITPLMSMARTLVDRQVPADVVFVHHARTPDDVVFRDELEEMGAAHPGIRVVVVCEADAPGERWAGHRGRISRALLDAVVPDLAQREVFVCGPPPYREAARRLVLEAGADPASVHEESYELGDGPVVLAPAPTADVTHEVELRRSGARFPCESGSTLLEAAARAGFTLPSSCQEGVCGTCRTTMLAGTVDMQHQGGIRPREVARGDILLCCSRPTDDLVLDA